ncbi:hypothetical protein P7K49_002437 [Saguinus oedipus]|uniref:Uncharacterized protein n=1 Tax=Saguinus oedipus TaxID=9490 RepID=A0ABQ9WHD0_SAGOE|nr:hypothetical protein P7K49_002437 [Saguinus oedipus]
MDDDFAPAPPEMQSHGAPGPRTSFSRSHVLGCPTRPSRLPRGGAPLTPVLRKTIHLDTFPQSHIPHTSSRPGLGARTQSVPPQEMVTALGASSSPLPTSSLVPRKLSSISFTLRQNSQARSLDHPISHWEGSPTPGTPHEEGRLSSPGSPPVTLVPGGRAHSEGPENPGLTKSSRPPAVGKPLVSSYLALPFQSRLAQSTPVLAEPGSVGQGHLVSATAHTPTRASPGKGKPRARGIPRPRGRLQRATEAVNLTAVDTRIDAARYLATVATNRPSLAISLATQNTSRLDTGTEFPALDIKLGTARDLPSGGIVKSGKAMNLATAGTIKPGTAMNLTTVQTIKPGVVMDLTASDPDKLGKAMATRSTAKPDMNTEGTAMDLATSDPLKLDIITATVGTTRLETAMALARAKRTKLGLAMNSLALDTSRMGTAVGSVVPVTPDPATGKNTLGSVNNLTISDVATCLVMPSRCTDPALDHTNASMDGATEPATLDLATESKGKCRNLPSPVSSANVGS